MTAVVPRSKVQAHLERQQLPSPARIAQQAHWWSTDGAKGAGVLLLKLPLLVVFELRPIFRGLGRVLSGWASWCAAADHAERLTGADDKTQKAAERLESRKEGRRRLSLIVFVALVGVTWWAVVVHPEYLVVAGFVVVAVLDWAGRRGQTTVESLPPPLRVVLKEGVPLSQITASLLATFEREGIEVGVDQPLRYDAGRSDYRILVSCRDEITAEHLRALERGIGASDHTIRLLATDIATVRELVIRDGDPLAEVPQPDWIPTGTRSIESGALDLGESMTEVPFALDFAGVHIRIVAGTGGGKTAWFLRNCIDRLSSCRDAVLWGVDLTAGPELPLWRAVIQRRAFTPEDAEELLTAALVEIDRRAKILAGFAEDDDPSNDDITEWCSQLGPWLVIVIDEFSTLAEYNGKPAGELDLLKLAKQIIRTGRKHGVSLVMFAQRTGTEDFGSTVMSTQAGTAIVGPCDMTDTVNVFGKDRRDQGYAPHLLTPGTKESANDAGKCYVDSPRHRTADLYRAYAPLSAGEVKRRARQRIADGLPVLHEGVLALEEATVVPESLTLLERVFAEYDADRIPSATVLEFATEQGDQWTDMSLADALRPHGVETHKARTELAGGRSVMCYYRTELQAALGSL